jgi:beta-galactosidase
MDVFRVPKFSYHFYRSQRGPSEGGCNWVGGPVVFIASHWTAASDLRVLVYSNCEEIELRLNGESVARKRPDAAWMSQHLPHPPFVFDLLRFTPGTLEAVGYGGNLPCANHRISTPERASVLELVIDDLGVTPNADESDVVIVHARLRDVSGALCIEEAGTVTFAFEGNGALAGPACIQAEAGVASNVLRLAPGAAAIGYAMRASCGALAATLSVAARTDTAVRPWPEPVALQPA